MNKVVWDRHKKLRLVYFGRHFAKLLVPRPILQWRRRHLLASIDEREREVIHTRVRYYNKVVEPFNIGCEVAPLRLFHARGQHNYYLDLIEYLRFFPAQLRVNFRFGDATCIPATPTIVKARPIEGDNSHSVLFKLNHIRHFNFIKDRRTFTQKQNRLVWRGHAFLPNRIQFLENFFNHKLCDVGQAGGHDANPLWRKPFMNIEEQLAFKFILSIEGNDVATNLKWILSSNSLCFMTRPKFETWFMEGTLIPEQHYVLLADDYSDLDEKIRFYAHNPAAAQRILDNAHRYVEQFRNPRRETIISLLVLQKYFELSGVTGVELRA